MSKPEADELLASRRSLLRGALALLLTTPAMRVAAAVDIYKTFQTPEAFLAEAFGATPPPAQTLDLDDAKQSQLATVFGRRYPQARLRYWRAAGRTAWIFDDVGKEGYVPTTAGFVVQNGAIDFARVLVYRESRGEQVAERSFLQQLAGAKAAGAAIDRKVDNISGATYSVKMMQRMARTALTLDSLAG
ncbi:MAG TPA: FMN-binding protein [Solimonas sp.]|nr:FMN-binding protein [Solimonas sp.]